jgi:hypothetical protein
MYHGMIVIVGDDRDADARARLIARLGEALEPSASDIEDVVSDIAMALLGRSITFGPAAPSSPVPNGVRVHGL